MNPTIAAVARPTFGTCTLYGCLIVRTRYIDIENESCSASHSSTHPLVPLSHALGIILFSFHGARTPLNTPLKKNHLDKFGSLFPTHTPDGNGLICANNGQSAALNRCCQHTCPPEQLDEWMFHKRTTGKDLMPNAS
jgi:hypothetical protein